MSLTGQLQAIGSRGYSLRWSTAPADQPKYATLVLEILDRAGAVVATDRRPMKVSGSVITKEGEEAQRTAQIAWAEEVTRSPLTPPTESPVPVVEDMSHGEEISPPIPGINTVEAEAHDPV